MTKAKRLFPLLFAYTFCLFSFSITALAQSFTIEQVLSAPFPSGLIAAKNAPRIAWIFDKQGSRNVWIADAPEFAPKQITHYSGDDGQQMASLRITPDGKTVLYVRGTEVNGAGNSANPNSLVTAPKQQAFSADVAGGEPRLLGEVACGEEGCEDLQVSPDGLSVLWATRKHIWTAPVAGGKKAEQIEELAGENDSPRWSPDGKRIAFHSGRKDHSYVVVLEPATKKVTYLAPTVDRDDGAQWSPDGKQIVFFRRPGLEYHQPLIPIRVRRWAVWIGDPQSGAARELWHSGNTPNDSFPHFAYESLQFTSIGRIVFASEQDGRNHLYSIAVDGGQPQLLTPGDFDVEDVQLSADKRSVLYSSNQEDVDRRHIWRVSATGGAPQALTKGETMEWNPIETADGKEVLCLGSTATSPSMPYRITKSGRELISKNAIPADFPEKQLVPPQQVIFKADDGMTIHGQLFVPKGLAGKNGAQAAPALIFTHGGPPRQMMLGFHYMQYYYNAYAANQYLASKGYVVLSVNYRLGIMYGRAFREPENAGWRGASEYKDVLAGARYLQSLNYVDKKRIGLWGGSYGGYLTALGLARNSDLFSAGVDFHGVHDWSARLAEWEGNSNSAPDLKPAVELAFKSSPVADVGTWRSPVLFIHGDDDRNVDFQQTTDLVQRVRKQNVYFEQMIIPDEIHDLLKWSDWVRAYKATGDFFDRKMTGAAAGH